MERIFSSRRLFWLDAARAFAIISITFNHAINRAFDMHNDTMLENVAKPSEIYGPLRTFVN